MGELLARAIYDNLNRFIVPDVAGPSRLVPLPALADRDFSLVALRQPPSEGDSRRSWARPLIAEARSCGRLASWYAG